MTRQNLENLDELGDFWREALKFFKILTDSAPFDMCFIQLIDQFNIVPFFAILHNIVP